MAATIWSAPGIARAADAPADAPPVISISAKKASGNYNVANKSTVQSGGGGDKKGGSQSSSTTGTSTKGWVEMTVRNSGKTAAKGLVIKYTVYIQTSTSGDGGSAITWTKADGSQTIDNIDPGKTATVLSDPVQKGSTITENSQGGGGGKKGGGGAKTTGSVTNTDIAGWYIEAVYNDKTIFKREEPNGIKKKAETSM